MSSIDLEVADGVAVVTVNSPETRNALNPQLCSEMLAVCDQVDADESVGAAVIRGSNNTFCSGAERSLLARNGEDPADPERYTEIGGVYQAFQRVGRLQVPTIAAACGAAVGAGVNLLLATDLRIVAHDLRIIAGFTRIGIHPGGGHFTLLARLLGGEGAAALGVFGEEIDGDRAAALGLAWAAVDAGDVDSAAREFAARAASDPDLSRRVVASFRREIGPPGMSWEVAVDFERGPQMWSLRRRGLRTVVQK